MSASTNFRHNIRALMAEKGVSQRKLAAIIGMSYPHVNRILQGLYEPTIDTAEKMAGALGEPLEKILRDALAVR